MARVTRRKFLKVSGAGAVAAKTGGMAGILATSSAPAFAQATTVHWIRWNDFVPASDQLLAQGAAARGREGARHQDQPGDGQRQRPAAAHHLGDPVGRRSRPLHAVQQPPAALRRERSSTCRDVAEAIGKAQGGYYPLVKSQLATTARSGSRCRGPSSARMIAYRKSWFEEVGSNKFPETWEKYHEVGKKLKAKGRPIGQTLGHTFGDAPTFTYPLMWSFGGKEVDESGKVVINTKETIESVKFMTGVLEGRARRGRPRLGRHQQQPRLPLADHLRRRSTAPRSTSSRCAIPTST